jgi:glycerol-3-phosphate dehydrogenase
VGGVEYWDAQFDDARLALALARTAASQGALLLNHMPVTGLITEYPAGRIKGLSCLDTETGQERSLKVRCVVNATGVWIDQIEAMLHSQPSYTSETQLPHSVRPSQGVHLVVDESFWPGSSALLVPHTQDGRVLFAVPWQGKVLLGTTDTPRPQVDWEPQALESEIEQILQEAAKYLVKVPLRSDVSSVWAGLRPLARNAEKASGKGATHNVSREHSVKVAANGLVSVMGGKWTTYRAMAADVMQSIRKAQLLSLTSEDVTLHTKLWGAPEVDLQISEAAGTAPKPAAAFSAASRYGTDASLLSTLPGAERWIAPQLSEAMVRFAARYEYARTVEDVLARRNRLLFLDAAAALTAAPEVAEILSTEISASPQLAPFEALAKTYKLPQQAASN